MMLDHSSNDYDSKTGTWDDAWIGSRIVLSDIIPVIRRLVKASRQLPVRRHLEEVCHYIESGWVVEPVHQIHERLTESVELGAWLQANSPNVIAVKNTPVFDKSTGALYDTVTIFFDELINGYKAIQIIW